jgi:hypothetical protein
MVLVHLTAFLQKVRPLRAPMLVVAVSALIALLFTIAMRPSAPELPRAADAAAMQLMRTEHDLVAASVQGIQAAIDAEWIEASQERERQVATVEVAPPHQTATVAEQPRRAALAGVVPVPRPSPALESPLQLQSAAIAPRERPHRSVAGRVGAVLATVEEIPSWLRAGVENVADWAIAAPAKTLSRLPERRFL